MAQSFFFGFTIGGLLAVMLMLLLSHAGTKDEDKSNNGF